MRDPISQNKMRGSRGMISEVDLWFPHKCVYTPPHTQNLVFKYAEESLLVSYQIEQKKENVVAIFM